MILWCHLDWSEFSASSSSKKAVALSPPVRFRVKYFSIYQISNHDPHTMFLPDEGSLQHLHGINIFNLQWYVSTSIQWVDMKFGPGKFTCISILLMLFQSTYRSKCFITLVTFAHCEMSYNCQTTANCSSEAKSSGHILLKDTSTCSWSSFGFKPTTFLTRRPVLPPELQLLH